MRLIDAITHSCDVDFYDLARRVGVDALGAMARRFGFGERLGLGLPGEQGGFVPTREWKQATYGEPWQGGETLIIGIGQVYRLQALAGDRASANRLCAALKADGLACFVK